MRGPSSQDRKWRPGHRVSRAVIAVLCLAVASCGTRDTRQARTPRPSLPPAAAYSGTGGAQGAGEAQDGTSLTVTRTEAKVFPGTGVFLASPPDAGNEGEEGKYTVNFVNADVKQVVDRVLGDVLKANYVVEEEVSGKITIQTASPVRREDLIPILESALGAQGASLVEDGGVYRIMATEKAGRTGGLPDPSALGFGIRAVPLQYVSATEMEKILKPIAPEGAIRRIDRTRNIILLSGTSRELSNMIETIRLFDVDWLKGMSFALLPVQSADADAVAEELKTVFAAEDGGPGEGVVRFVPVKRLNAILAISSQESYVRRAAAWAERLDQFGEGSGKQLFVYDVQNRPAAELADLLQQAFSDQPARGKRRETGVAPGLQPVTLARREDAQENEKETEKQDESKPASAPPPPRRTRTEPVVDSDRLRIFADESNNSLVIIASPQDHKLAVKMVERLDVIPNQVLLEATIAEVTLEDELSFGLQWFFRSGEMKFKFTDIADGVVGPVFPGFSYLFSGGNARVALNAISSLTDVKVISSPTLMVLDNKTATLQVGDEVPVVTQQAQRVEDNDGGPIINAIEFRNTGVILKVTPRVNESGVVLLDIEQEVSNVVETTSSGIDSPTIRQRRIQTSVAVHSGESLALGGLIRESDSRNQSGVPFLSRVPVLGNLFKSKTDRHDRTELLVLITPRVVRNQGEARAVTEELRGRLRALQPLDERIE